MLDRIKIAIRYIGQDVVPDSLNYLGLLLGIQLNHFHFKSKSLTINVKII